MNPERRMKRRLDAVAEYLKHFEQVAESLRDTLALCAAPESRFSLDRRIAALVALDDTATVFDLAVVAHELLTATMDGDGDMTFATALGRDLCRVRELVNAHVFDVPEPEVTK